ncbi:STAS domain-containing protein [Streptomyces beijiangensis]|uniref:Anti-sigma factor antagonist n=1 Tax=Streptomyces beijiangensis TaxID=163361 RepID=A0A939FEZ6_9ACTN|nr:STAS domain-containing protein [Streptomyces beijiangensis]MBO0516864.1 STAS domain-containing protein [Streptomyces beijiangensis]
MDNEDWRSAPCSTPTARTYVLGTATVVELRGSLDLATAPGVRAHLDAAAAPPGARVIVDLRPAEFFDCITLGLLCRARRRTLESDGHLNVVCTRPWHLRILTAVGLDTALRPVATLGHALAQAARPQDTAEFSAVRG